MMVVIFMSINEIIVQSGMTKYRIAKLSGIPHATLNDLCTGKTRIEKCSGETLYRLSKALRISIELLLESAMEQKLQLEKMQMLKIQSYEFGLPDYLQQDLDAFKAGLKTNSTLLDCLWSELYGSINIAEINEGVITPEHADYLRQKFLWR
jgi:plasmid maintenance system antidote protein VapI